MAALLIGYARCSTDTQDLTAQREALINLGVEGERGSTSTTAGTARERPGLREALAARVGLGSPVRLAPTNRTRLETP